MFGPVDESLIFEDNLIMHKTDGVFLFIENELNNFIPPVFLPALLTFIIQVIDRHIGIIYKLCVYKAVRKDALLHLNAAHAAAIDDTAVANPLTPKEKHILVTKVIGDCHEQLTESNTYWRGFIATGTWMPISHMVKDAEGNYPGPQNAPEDSKVNLQHMNDYDYHNRFIRDKVLRTIQIIRD